MKYFVKEKSKLLDYCFPFIEAESHFEALNSAIEKLESGTTNNRALDKKTIEYEVSEIDALNNPVYDSKKTYRVEYFWTPALNIKEVK